MRYMVIYLLLLFSGSAYSQFVAVAGGGQGGVEASQLLDSLFVYYPLDESSGNFEDVHGSRDLTASGTLTYSVGGKVGTCVTFITDAQGKYTPDDFHFPGSFSIQCWMKTNSTSAYKGLVTYYTTTERGWASRMDNGGASNAVATSGRYYSGGGTVVNGFGIAVNDDSWHHVITTYNAANDELKIYVDDVLRSTTTSATATGYETGCNFEIGSYNDAGFLDGELDEIAVWRGRVLLQGAVDSLWNSGNGLAYPLDF